MREIEKTRRIIAGPDKPHRSTIARAVCERSRWGKPDGGLKVVSCNVALGRMDARGWITLPPPLRNAAGESMHYDAPASRAAAC